MAVSLYETTQIISGVSLITAQVAYASRKPPTTKTEVE